MALQPLPPLSSSSTLPQVSKAALDADEHLLICCACGTQFPSSFSSSSSSSSAYSPAQTSPAPSRVPDCPICIDDRQFIPASGQTYTSLYTLKTGQPDPRFVSKSQDDGRDVGGEVDVKGPVKNGGEKHEVFIMRDREDERIGYLVTKPSVAIGQTPILIETNTGSFIWDCSAFISAELILFLQSLSSPLKGIAISHPHFYSTSLTWARALQVPLYISSADKHWFQRLSDVRESEAEVQWYDNDRALSEDGGIRLIRCGGHFPGSAVLFWDRSREAMSTQSGKKIKETGLILCADTMLVQPHQRGFTFQWSVPNMIPMNPQDLLNIHKALSPYSFDQASSTWPGRFVRSDAKKALTRSIRKQLAAVGIRWNEETDQLHFTLGTGAKGGLEA